MKIYGLVFRENGKIYNFKSDLELSKNDLVVVDSEKGIQLARICHVISKLSPDQNIDEIKQILRKATDEDYEVYLKNTKESTEILKYVKELVTKMNIDMSVLSVSYTLNKDVLLINFVADDRVDFRELAKKLAAKYKTRIELHQVGARDKAKEVSGVGRCGQKLCCSRFLNQMNSVSMNMAKNQGLSLNPSKINGSCGRLLCCLAYEDEIYSECNKDLPKLGSKYKYNGKEGQVISINILKKTFIVQVDDEKFEVQK